MRPGFLLRPNAIEGPDLVKLRAFRWRFNAPRHLPKREINWFGSAQLT